MVGPAVAAGGEGSALLDAVAVDQAQVETDRAEAPGQQDPAVVGDPGHAVGDVVLEGQAHLPREHEVRDLELAEHHLHAGAEGVVVADPGVLDEHAAVLALLGEDAVEVRVDVVGERRPGEQLDPVRGLDVGVGGLLPFARAVGGAELAEALNAHRQGHRVRKGQAVVAVALALLAPVGQAVAAGGEVLPEAVELGHCGVTGGAGHLGLAGERGNRRRRIRKQGRKGQHGRQSDRGLHGHLIAGSVVSPMKDSQAAVSG